MAKHSGPYTVQCYHCRHRFEVAGRAQSTSCPGCYKPVIVGNVVVDKLKPVREVRTCGKVTVRRRGRIIADLIEAHVGVECLGTIDVKKVIAGPIVIGPKARWKGDCHACSLVIKPGAQIAGGHFVVPDNELGLADLLKHNKR